MCRCFLQLFLVAHSASSSVLEEVTVSDKCVNSHQTAGPSVRQQDPIDHTVRLCCAGKRVLLTTNEHHRAARALKGTPTFWSTIAFRTLGSIPQLTR